MTILVGVDAGATRTRALAVDDHGSEVGAGRGGPASPHNVGPAVAAAEIARAIRSASLSADTIVVGVAGVEAADLRHDLQREVQAMLPGREIHLYPDAVIALDGAFLGGPGIIVVAGTGSIAWGRDEGGREARAGGWGHVVDDAGSGYDIARRGLTAVLRAFDGRGPSTVLVERLPGALATGRTEQIVDAVQTMSPAGIAALAPLVVTAAAEGDAVSRQIVTEGCAALAEAAAAVARALRLTGPHAIAAAGGLFTHPLVRQMFTAALARLSPLAAVTSPRLTPVGGAVWKAFALNGIEPEGAVIAALEAAAAGEGRWM